MDKVDIILAIPLLWGAINGFRKGLILELASLVALILGIYGAIHFSDYTAAQLSASTEIPFEWIGLLSFLITFIGIVFGVFLLAKALSKAVKMVALGMVNRILGSLFGLLKFAVILSALLYFFNNLNRKFEFIPADYKKKSVIASTLESIHEPLSSILSSFEVEKIQEEAEELINGE